ncbi:MAG TPA: hypothetical protein VF200_10615, partial [Woeseiaceae bacterium]
MAGRIARASLQRKVSLTLLAVMAAMVLVSWLILHGTVTPAFNRLERSAAETDMVRVRRAIQNELDKLATTA